MLQHLGIQVLSAIIIHCHCLTDINCLVVVFLSCDRLDGTRWSDKAQDSMGIDGLIRYNHLFISFWVLR